MFVYGYTRLNISRETPEGMALKEQSLMISKWAKSQKMKLKKIYCDQQPTSASLNLPRLEKLISQINKGNVSVLVIARLDRLTRSIRLYDRILEYLKENNVRFVSLMEGIDTAKKSGRLVFNTISILGCWEARAISDRTREMIERKKKIGERVGHAPYGYIYLDGSYHRIAKYLNNRQIPSKRGCRWYAETVKTICENPLYGTPLSQKGLTFQLKN